MFDVRAMVASVLDMVAPLAAAKGLKLCHDVASDVPEHLDGDVSRLRQVLLNLLSNAIKFTPEGEVVLTVRASATDASACELSFAVRDTGIGIEKAEQAQLFERVTEVDASGRRFAGSGLGLALCGAVVQEMGGKIWVESEPGHGSTFSFTVPARLVAGRQPPAYARGGQPDTGWAGKRVLVVDDNATSRSILVTQLRKWGMLAVEAGSEAEALAELGRTPEWDLAIIDQHMPGTDGLALAETIRRTPPAEHLVLILLVSGQEAEAPRPALFAATLTKPVGTQQLYQSLQAVLTPLTRSLSPSMPLQDPHADMATRRPLRILAATHEILSQKLTSRYLALLGYQADLAQAGAEVLEMLERQAYDVVLMDAHMPDMDGVTVTRRIRETMLPAEQPYIIGVVALASPEYTESSPRGGHGRFPEQAAPSRGTPRQPRARLAAHAAASDAPAHLGRPRR